MLASIGSHLALGCTGMDSDMPFWKTKRLEEMTRDEWESLCDGCGRCCLHKLRDEDTEALSFTNVACRLLDLHSCRCSDYSRRQRRVPDCVSLTPQSLHALCIPFQDRAQSAVQQRLCLRAQRRLPFPDQAATGASASLPGL